MAYFSALMGRSVCDATGQRLGKLVDLVVPAATDYPPIQALAVQERHGRDGSRHDATLVPWAAVAALDEDTIRLTDAWETLPAYETGDQELFLGRQVLDRQIIDINGHRVVRVNDL